MHILSLAITLFFVLDSFGNLPIVLSLLAETEKSRRIKIIIRESIIALALLVLFYGVGPLFLRILKVGAADLKICGGVVLGMIALRMVFPDGKAHDKESKPEPYIVPLAIPLIAGPSAMATVMIISAQTSENPFAGLGMIVLAWLVSTIVLLVGVRMGYFISQRLLVALERLSGLLLAVIAVNMLMTGIQSYLAH